MFQATKEQIKIWKNSKIYADFNPIDNDNANIFGFRFKDKTKEEAQTWLANILPEENFKVQVKNRRVIAEHYIIDTSRVSGAGYTYGTEHVITKKNGISIRLLVEPSEEYKAVLAARAAAAQEEQEAQATAASKEKLISDKMRELAIAELEKEGKL